MSEAIKYDDDKPKYHLIPPESLHAMAVVFTHGAAKYGEGNWQAGGGLDPARVIDALYRHLDAYRMSGDSLALDEHSGLPILAHVLTNAAMLYSLVHGNELATHRVQERAQKAHLVEFDTPHIPGPLPKPPLGEIPERFKQQPDPCADIAPWVNVGQPIGKARPSKEPLASIWSPSDYKKLLWQDPNDYVDNYLFELIAHRLLSGEDWRSLMVQHDALVDYVCGPHLVYGHCLGIVWNTAIDMVRSYNSTMWDFDRFVGIMRRYIDYYGVDDVRTRRMFYRGYDNEVLVAGIGFGYFLAQEHTFDHAVNVAIGMENGESAQFINDKIGRDEGHKVVTSDFVEHLISGWGTTSSMTRAHLETARSGTYVLLDCDGNTYKVPPENFIKGYEAAIEREPQDDHHSSSGPPERGEQCSLGEGAPPLPSSD